MALKPFYQLNEFRAHYCHQAEPETALKWMRRIGHENRHLLRTVYFYDRNERQDVNCPDELERVKDHAIMRAMGGELIAVSTDDCCKHRVTFSGTTVGW